ncbi:MJ1477/TM1410 family putative glycoside hydrolase [Candidatus Bipolaricaulota sp. J31]
MLFAIGGIAELNGSRAFLCQLQNARVPEIIASGYKFAIIDYSRDGSDAGRYRADEIGSLTRRGITVLAYLSIGEAEDYRYYWDGAWDVNRDGTPDPGAPQWLGRANPDWPGNYRVRYWDPAWQGIVLSYLERILAQGFSGVYLDTVDSFEYWSDPHNPEGEALPVDEAAHLMITFILRIARYARERVPRFLIVPQNAEWILDFDVDGSLFTVVAGWGVEDLFYWGTEPTTPEWRAERLPYLDRVVAAGKFVLSVDYVDDGTGYWGANLERIVDYVTKARARRYRTYVARADRALDEIVIVPGIQP